MDSHFRRRRQAAMPESVMPAGVRIVPLADRLDAVGQVAAWHWAEWGDQDPHGSAASWAARLRSRAHRDRIPTTFLAVMGEAVAGSCSLIEHDMETHPELGPWLAGVFVAPASRGQGIGTALARHALAAAPALGVQRLYLYTPDAQSLYARLGWKTVREEPYAGRTVSLMTIALDDA